MINVPTDESLTEPALYRNSRAPEAALCAFCRFADDADACCCHAAPQRKERIWIKYLNKTTYAVPKGRRYTDRPLPISQRPSGTT